jgi:hypothetical protein
MPSDSSPLSVLRDFVLKLFGRRVSTAEYWIGKNIPYAEIWKAYEDGLGYVDKYKSIKVHLIRISFAAPTPRFPLFNHEAVFKTIKGYFHDLKAECLSPTEYNRAGPLFLYSVDRGSGIWEFLGELRQLVLFGTTLADEKLMGEQLQNLDRRMKFLKENFGGQSIDAEDFERFMNAKTSKELETAFAKLLRQGLTSVQIAKEPFSGNIQESRQSLIELKATDVSGKVE